jgi:hypothetical protein
MKRAVLVGAFGLLVGSIIGSAQAQYVVYGFGTQSCGAWSSAGTAAAKLNSTVRDLIPRFENEAWVAGFVSGAGYESRMLRKTDSAGIVAWMDTYCAAHPLDAISVAAAKLTEGLKRP